MLIETVLSALTWVDMFIILIFKFVYIILLLRKYFISDTFFDLGLNLVRLCHNWYVSDN